MGSMIPKPSLEASALGTKGAAHPRHNHGCWCKAELTLMKLLQQALDDHKSSEVRNLNGSTGANKGWGKWFQVELDLGRLKEKPHWRRQLLRVCLFSLYPSNLKYSNLFQSIRFSFYFFKTWITLLAVILCSPASKKISEVFVVNSFQQRTINMKIDCVICHSIW